MPAAHAASGSAAAAAPGAPGAAAPHLARPRRAAAAAAAPRRRAAGGGLGSRVRLPQWGAGADDWAARRRSGGVACRGFLSNLFGGGGGGGKAAGPAPTIDDWSQEELDYAVLTELEGPGGAPARVVYRNGGAVDAAAVEALCDRVGWPRRPLYKVEAALANSFLVATLTLEPIEGASGGVEGAPSSGSSGAAAAAGDDASRPPPGQLVGLARCTSDGAFNATIWDVLVDPALQGRGLGKALVGGLVRTLLKREISNVTLFADAKVVDFYERLGFEAEPEGIRGMFWLPK